MGAGIVGALTFRTVARQREMEKAERGILGIPALRLVLPWVAEVEKVDGADIGEERRRERMGWMRRNQKRSWD